jgi:putative transposase
MPVKNIRKPYLKDGFYHLYNRGVEKRQIFLDNRDYKLFLYFLKRYLTQPKNGVQPRWKSDIYEKIQLIAYCLMPNHFHLMIKQYTKNAITIFMRSLATSYVGYFNRRYERSGPLFQSNYKAVLIETEPYLLHLSRYIHRNPLDLNDLNGVQPRTGSNLVRYPYSSYAEFLGKRKTKWIYPKEILDFFRTAQKTHLKDVLSYQSFVEDYEENPTEILGSLAIDS